MEEQEYDLVVYDDECSSMGEEYIKRAEKFNEILDKYMVSFKRVLDEGVKSGQTHDNLTAYYKSIEGLKGEIDHISNQAKKCTDGFVKDMDTSDSYLY